MPEKEEIKMAMTIKERREKLTAEIVKARDHYLATEREMRHKAKKENPNLEWYEIMDIVESEPKFIAAKERLLALCDAARIMGADIG